MGESWNMLFDVHWVGPINPYIFPDDRRLDISLEQMMITMGKLYMTEEEREEYGSKIMMFIMRTLMALVFASIIATPIILLWKL